MRRVSSLCAVVLVSLGLSACGEETCTPQDLTDALASAKAGDTVTVGACTIVGSFEVPTGVTLAGGGEDKSFLVVKEGEVGVVLNPGQQATRLTGVTVRSDGRAGVVAIGEGEVQIDHVRVEATRGVAMGFESVSHLVLSDVALVGPVTPENVLSFLPGYTHETTATHGLALVRVSQADLTRLGSTGFATFGVLQIEGVTDWQTGGASGNLRVGVMVHNGTLTVADVDLVGTLQGGLLDPAFAGVFTSGSHVESARLVVDDSDSYGLFHRQSTARHVDLLARGNGEAAVWVEESTSFEISGTGTEIADNAVAGVAVVESDGVVISDAAIGTTRSALHVVLGNQYEIGDGIELIGTPNATLTNLVLADNERAGLVVDITDVAAPNLIFDNVVVSGTGDQLGAVVQGGQLAAGWDSGLIREGDTALADGAFSGTLQVVGVIGPNFDPITSNMVQTGLISVIGPNF